MIELRSSDESYPPSLRAAQPHPKTLWVDGDAAALAAPCVAIVGTRRMTPYGDRVARELAGSLARGGAVIVSGLAQGIDCAAHAGALDAGGRSIAVLGEGITSFLENARGSRRRLAATLRRRGALISPYPPVVPAQGWMFAKRNLVIAALCRAVVVIEAPVGSGALITAAAALRLGRPLFAVPGPLGTRAAEGSNALIATGAARACVGAEQIALAAGIVASSLTTDDRLLDALAAGPLDLDTLVLRTGLSPSVLRSRLVRAIFSGTVVDRGDGRFGRG